MSLNQYTKLYKGRSVDSYEIKELDAIYQLLLENKYLFDVYDEGYPKYIGANFAQYGVKIFIQASKIHMLNIAMSAANRIANDVVLKDIVEDTYEEYQRLLKDGKIKSLPLYKLLYENPYKIYEVDFDIVLKYYLSLYRQDGALRNLLSHMRKSVKINEKPGWLNIILWVIAVAIAVITAALIIPFLIVLIYVYYKRRRQWTFGKILKVAALWPANLRKIARL